MKRVTLDKIASVTSRLGLGRHAVVGPDIPAKAGTVIAGRVLDARTTYDTLEDLHGRFVRLHPGDVIAGALGHRDALHGFSGTVPDHVAIGDTLQLLNLGGVLGVGAGSAPGLGEPFRIEVLGSILSFPRHDRLNGKPANIQSAALPSASLPTELPPIIGIVGTAMDSGKTTAATVLIAALARSGLRVAAGKLTGVSLRRDVLAMADCGADPVAIFTDFGVVTTNEANAVAAAHSVVGHVVESGPNVIVLEMGDGLLGTYGVHALLADAGLRNALTAVVVCANDPVGTWGAVELLRTRYSIAPVAVSGPVTDSPVGRRYCQEQLGLAAWNALHHPRELANELRPHVQRGAGLLTGGSA